MSEKLVPISAVLQRTGYKSNSTVYAKISNGSFPPPIKINDGSNTNRWLESEIDNWIEEQIETSRHGEFAVTAS